MDDTEALIYPLGDLHIGDRGFTADSKERLQKLIRSIARTPKARVILMGDIFNVATTTSPSSPHDQEWAEDEQLDFGVRLFRPIADRIDAAVPGNHEQRTQRHSGARTLRNLCRLLGRDRAYCEYSAFVEYTVRSEGLGRQVYRVYAHHTTGGGQTIGGPLNRVYKLRDIADADVYLGGHNHDLIFAQRPVVRRGRFRLQTYVLCGQWLYWGGSYAEAAMMAPRRVGSPLVRLSAAEWKVRVEA